MRFKIDENLPVQIKLDLLSAGHDAETVVDEGMGGASDPVLMQHIQQEKRTLLTMDKGVANVRRYSSSEFPGIVLFRPDMQGRGATLAFVRRHLTALLASDLQGRLLVVSGSGIRVR